MSIDTSKSNLYHIDIWGYTDLVLHLHFILSNILRVFLTSTYIDSSRSLNNNEVFNNTDKCNLFNQYYRIFAGFLAILNHTIMNIFVHMCLYI